MHYMCFSMRVTVTPVTTSVGADVGTKNGWGKSVFDYVEIQRKHILFKVRDVKR
jgi:hypothetical protein